MLKLEDVPLIRQREKGQPPYSVVADHRIDTIINDGRFFDNILVWCKCGTKLNFRKHHEHVIEMMLDEMIGKEEKPDSFNCTMAPACTTSFRHKHIRGNLYEVVSQKA